MHVFPQISESVARARAMVAEGRGDERASFTDLNIRGPFSIETTAAIYLSFFDPTGPANILDNTTRLREPLLWVAGTEDSESARAGLCLRPSARQPVEPLRHGQRGSSWDPYCLAGSGARLVGGAKVTDS